jgi:predicted nuclease with TOPRIM domain
MDWQLDDESPLTFEEIVTAMEELEVERSKLRALKQKLDRKWMALARRWTVLNPIVGKIGGLIVNRSKEGRIVR